MSALMRDEATAVPRWLGTLSPREVEVLDLVALGLSNSEIAADLVISVPTVKTHVAQCLRKMGARDRVQLVVTAYVSGYATVSVQPSVPPAAHVPMPRRSCGARRLRHGTLNRL